MVLSVDPSSPANVNKESARLMGSSPRFSPSSDKLFWSALRGRVDTILENRKREGSVGESDRGARLKEDSLLLLRGFDSIAHSLCLLGSNLDDALEGARDLAKPPTLTEMFHSKMEKAESKEEESAEEEENGGCREKRLKRKPDDTNELSEDQGGDSQKENDQGPKDRKLKKAKTLAISMATKAASLARELKSIKSDLCFMQERCVLLEEENSRLRDGFDKGIRPEEDDLVRLQLEALLAEKSRLANENANLTRENQCLHQLVEYHQLTSQEFSASYDQVLQGMCLDFSSPPPPIAEEGDDNADIEATKTPRTNTSAFSSLDECYGADE
ncbi:uncharacterized protein LOC131155225 [Malania oleifera]|uniref:uncharacterized protein LOC131155225 n=1 Tax=Malania oleifera TaxID=397392 RepID=UPI0025AE412E|nr:uncharacterized protein LOC131155225 [Malania oleifera]